MTTPAVGTYHVYLIGTADHDLLRAVMGAMRHNFDHSSVVREQIPPTMSRMVRLVEDLMLNTEGVAIAIFEHNCGENLLSAYPEFGEKAVWFCAERPPECIPIEQVYQMHAAWHADHAAQVIGKVIGINP